VSFLPILIVAVLLVGVMTFTRRNRARAVQKDADEKAKIGFGTDVMTTSGLYGTVVGINEDDTVQLAIAPGVEVKWARAGVRDVTSLPGKYRPGGAPDDETHESNESNEPPGHEGTDRA